MVHLSRGPAKGAPARAARANVPRSEGVCLACPYVRRLWRDQRGASLIEYAIIAALITVLVVVTVAVAGSWLYSTWVHLLSLLG